MKDFIITLSDKNYVNHIGLHFIAQFLNDSRIFSTIKQISKIKKNTGSISDYDIIKTCIALICLGKTNFDDVEQYRDDRYFKKALKLKTVPSAPTLRQRLETYDEEMWETIRQINIELIKAFYSDESIEVCGKNYTIIESDVTPFDNSDTKKEGVARTYKNFFGYAPMMSYTGASGFMLNNELRNGDAHSNCAGTDKYFTETIELAKQLGSEPLLAIMDSGNDDSKLVSRFIEQGTEFIIKRNLRREPIEKYINYAIDKYEKKIEDEKTGGTTYYTRWEHRVGNRAFPIAVVVTKTTMDKKKQQSFLMAQYDVDVYWNSLNLEADIVEEQYHKHGTSEQYHSEFKSDLDMERLPSGKFASNYTIMLLGMLSFNLLRIAGKQLLLTGMVPGVRRGKRLRIRTVIQNIMYMAGQYIEHARQSILRIFRGNPWTASFALIT
jgi:hypothetical protein